MTRPRNCRHCTSMCCGDANWCHEYQKCMTDAQITANRKCEKWEWNPIDALTLAEWESFGPIRRRMADGQLRLIPEVTA